ncbi:hypothetical protein ColLi_01694 [Colletotrichum liriopes]|uniref:Secreted protein n=1 Tax=Colletotrichum liriopes TaxID=708192 RepID=A0AA37GDD6_9PEZI|nr:hypothetical protein ColLi_01694 [Colletotrichum liriopes]
MRTFTFIVIALASAVAADYTSYCCGDSTPFTPEDIAWALDSKNGRITEMGVAGGAQYTYQTGWCTFGGDQRMACGKYTTSARTNERAGTKLAKGFLECDDVLYMKSNLWSCPF